MPDQSPSRTVPGLDDKKAFGNAGLGARMAAGAVGGTVGGLVVSALLYAKQVYTGADSDFVRMQRQLGRHSAWPRRGAATDSNPVAYAAHLALSAAAGAAYGGLKPRSASVMTAGLTFGLGLGVAHGVGQAALSDEEPPTSRLASRLTRWRDTGPDVAQHLALNALFGLATALVAQRLGRRLTRG